MEENFSERTLPIYPRMSRLVLARGLTTAGAQRARGRAPASAGSSARLLCGPVQINQPRFSLLLRMAELISCAGRPRFAEMESKSGAL